MERAYLPMRGRLALTVTVFGVLTVCGGLGAMNWVFAIGGPYGLITELAQLVGVLVAMIVFIVWLKRAHWNANAVQPGVTRHDAGWVPTVWFVPAINHYRPLQMVVDVWRAAGQGNAALPVGWWIVFVAQGWAWWLAAFAGGPVFKSLVWTAADVGYVVAAFLTLLLVLQITQGLDARRQYLEGEYRHEHQRRFSRPAVEALHTSSERNFTPDRELPRA